MSWHYVAAVETIDGEKHWTVRERYTAAAGGRQGWSSPIDPYGSSLDDLCGVLRAMLADIERHPPLDLDREAE